MGSLWLDGNLYLGAAKSERVSEAVVAFGKGHFLGKIHE
jgi:hypothetical protein